MMKLGIKWQQRKADPTKPKEDEEDPQRAQLEKHLQDQLESTNKSNILAPEYLLQLRDLYTFGQVRIVPDCFCLTQELADVGAAPPKAEPPAPRKLSITT